MTLGTESWVAIGDVGLGATVALTMLSAGETKADVVKGASFCKPQDRAGGDDASGKAKMTQLVDEGGACRRKDAAGQQKDCPPKLRRPLAMEVEPKQDASGFADRRANGL